MKQFSTLSIFLLVAATATSAQGSTIGPSAGPPLSDDSSRLSETISGLKASEKAMYLYERIERVESQKDADDPKSVKIQISRVFPAGTGLDHIPLGPNGKPSDEEAYRTELEKLLKSLQWAAETGQDQKEAYDKIEKKIRERDELIDATRDAFIFTYMGRENREGRVLLKYRMDPNPDFKPTNHSAALFSKVKGYVWIDDATSQLARVQGKIYQDISFGLFLGKIYKGSTFLQERYQLAPGLWLPTYTDIEFNGRKFFSRISIHEKTYYSHYRRVGPPQEALPMIRNELRHLVPGASAAQGSDP